MEIGKSDMEQPEAEALARIALTQTGLTARYEQTEGGAWSVLLSEDDHVHIFPDARSYRIWRDERAGVVPGDARRRSRLFRWFRRRSSAPEVGLPDESIKVSSLHVWATNAGGAIRSMDLSAAWRIRRKRRTTDTVRHTHPTRARVRAPLRFTAMEDVGRVSPAGSSLTEVAGCGTTDPLRMMRVSGN
jgi:hypothetical protein